MWKLLRSFHGGGHKRAVLFFTKHDISFVNKINLQLERSVISRNYSSSGVKLASTNVIPSGRQQRFKSPEEEDKESGIPAGGWFILVIPISTLALGVWQVFRWRWKLGLIDEMRKKTTADPVPLPFEDFELAELEYCKVKVRGEFDYSNEVLMGPRGLVKYEDKSEHKNRGVFSSASGNNGYHVITPFKVEGTNDSILINRGWISSRNPTKFKHVEGPVEIVGVVRKTENRAPFMSKNKPGQTLLHYRDVPTMAEVLHTKEVFLDLYSIDGVDFSQAIEDSVPVPRQTRVTLRNEHVSYFVTWFSLSAITSLMWHRLYIRKLPLL